VTEPFLTIDGLTGTGGALRAPGAGGWTLDAELDAPRVPTGAVEVRIAGQVLRGTVDDEHSGTFGERRRVRVVGGAGWSTKTLERRHYRNDGPSGVARSVVLQQAAEEIGETLVLDAQAEGRLGTDFIRPAWPAGDVLRQAIGPWSWWVDFAGVTHVGLRPIADAGPHEVLEFDPAEKVAKVAVDDLVAVAPGSRLVSPLFEAPFIVRDLEVDVSGGSFVLTCWGAYEATAAPAPVFERFIRVLRAFVRAFTRRYDFHGVYRYRVVSQSGDRVTLQAVAKKPLPDIRSVTIAAGTPGLRAVLQSSGFVLVSFVDGDPGQPVITHFWRAGEPTWKPLELELAAQDELRFVVGRDVAADPTGRPVLYGDACTLGTASGFMAPTGTPPTSKAVFS
jgi:hypothetical protein